MIEVVDSMSGMRRMRVPGTTSWATRYSGNRWTVYDDGVRGVVAGDVSEAEAREILENLAAGVDDCLGMR